MVEEYPINLINHLPKTIQDSIKNLVETTFNEISNLQENLQFLSLNLDIQNCPKCGLYGFRDEWAYWITENGKNIPKMVPRYKCGKCNKHFNLNGQVYDIL